MENRFVYVERQTKTAQKRSSPFATLECRMRRIFYLKHLVDLCESLAYQEVAAFVARYTA